MNTPYQFDAFDEERMVYVRPVEAADLPDDVQKHVGKSGQLFAVHNAEGERLALVRDRRMAFALARQNDLAPVNVH